MFDFTISFWFTRHPSVIQKYSDIADTKVLNEMYMEALSRALRSERDTLLAIFEGVYESIIGSPFPYGGIQDPGAYYTGLSLSSIDMAVDENGLYFSSSEPGFYYAVNGNIGAGVEIVSETPMKFRLPEELGGQWISTHRVKTFDPSERTDALKSEFRAQALPIIKNAASFYFDEMVAAATM